MAFFKKNDAAVKKMPVSFFSTAAVHVLCTYHCMEQISPVSGKERILARILAGILAGWMLLLYKVYISELELLDFYF
jgi:hypothetical protein